MRQRRRRFWTAAVLATLLAAVPARAQVSPTADAGAASDAGAAPAAVDAGATDAGAQAEVAPAPPPPPAITASQVATMMLATPAPVDTEPPRPITRRLWFWLAVTGAVVAGVLIGIAVQHPNHTWPDCPPDYVCPR